MFKDIKENLQDFIKARYGMFVHYGLFSIPGRGEWIMNKELIYPDEYRKLADDFNPVNFDADKICAMAKKAGMKYICPTTMHHDGFMLYDSDLSDFNSVKYCGRDLVRELIDAARKYGLRVHLYHSLNDWSATPDAVAALENKEDYDLFIENTFARFKELVTKYSPIDVLWYDGWWPFDKNGWQAEKMNKMVREIQPWILFNGRNGLDGDFGTPEGHVSAPEPWRPWEACITHNDNWSYVTHDDQWKSPYQLITMLLTVAKGNGNLMLNVGPKADGSIPEEAEKILMETGEWLNNNHEAVFDTDVFTFNLEERGDKRGDWAHTCVYSASGNNLYLTIKFWPGSELVITGLETAPEKVSMLADGVQYEFDYNQENGKLVIKGLPEEPPALRPVLKVECVAPPKIYRCGGMRTPNATHPPYDPCSSDLQWS